MFCASPRASSPAHKDIFRGQANFNRATLKQCNRPPPGNTKSPPRIFHPAGSCAVPIRDDQPSGRKVAARSRKAFATTLTDDSDMAAAAMTGESSTPNAG